MLAVGVVVLLAASPGISLAAWTPTGAALNVSATVNAITPSIASVGSVPYVAWTEGNSNPLHVYVASFDGTSWRRVGGALDNGTNGRASSPSIAYVNGILYVAFVESNQIYVAQMEGDGWHLVAGALDNGLKQVSAQPSIADVGGVPWVAWAESNQIYVAKLEGDGWHLVGAALDNGFKSGSGYPSIAAGVDGVPYVAWQEPNGSGYRAYVASFDGTNWFLVGGALDSGAQKDAMAPSVAIVGHVPYVAWQESNGRNDEVYVARLQGGGWPLVGGALNVDPLRSGEDPRIADIGGVPHVAWNEAFAGAPPSVRYRVYVKQFRAGAWQAVGGALNIDPSQYANQASIANVGGIPYVAWKEVSSGGNDQVHVSRLEPDFLSESATPSATGATLTAQINDYGIARQIGFEYGTTPGFGSRTSLQSTSGSGVWTVTEDLSGLASGTGYFYRAFASDGANETSQGPTLTFATPGFPRASPVLPTAAAIDHISKLMITPSRIIAAANEPSATVALARNPGALVSYTGTQPAVTTFTVQRPLPGRHQGRGCAKPTNRNRGHRRCTRWVNVGSFIHIDLVGANRFRFTGRIRGHKLTPGGYRLQAIPRNTAGTGPAAYGTFSVRR